ncbi:DUF4202 domain-containing protein [Maribacter sp.]|uniref:DUF4202 domain-containing protein n=1 Tax=Maribacter sp. TaxID=1897614 RepID=UPI0025BBF163|nr:DUF4202 domain-containing protein [Maribacter sp.]
MATLDKLQKAFSLFDTANEKDPNKELYQGKTYAKEVLYATRMTNKLNTFIPNASEALQLTARCQHICRWEIARDSYDMNRTGYLKWRQDLKKHHAKKASSILNSIDYEPKVIEQVAFLLEKKQLKKNKETQILEDVICLVFLEYYFEVFAQKYPEEKLIDILQKTWRKMSKKGHESALKLPFSDSSLALVTKALS